MECLTIKTWEQIQFDNEAYLDNVLIYKNGSNYCTYNKSAMRMADSFRENPFIIEHLHVNRNDCLIKITFSPNTFESIKKKYKVVALPMESDHLHRWLVYTQYPPVSDYSYHIWSRILRLELKNAPAIQKQCVMNSNV